MQTTKKELLTSLQRSDLLRAALMVSQIEDVDFSETPYVEKILEMAGRVLDLSRPNKDDTIFLVENINRVLYDEVGLVGKAKSYQKLVDNPNQYYIHRVFERKKGSPLTFALIYWILAEQVGLDCDCVAFPANYLLKVNDIVGEFYVDPFNQGRVLTAAEFLRKFKANMHRNQLASTHLYENLTPAQLIGKLIQRLKHVYILKSDAIHALRAVELLTAVHPNSPELTRDRGILYCEVEYFSRAVKDLRSYIKARPNAEDIKDIRKLHRMLQGYSETIN